MSKRFYLANGVARLVLAIAGLAGERELVLQA